MTPEERDRLTRVEVQFAEFRELVETDLTDIKTNTAALMRAFNMGQGRAIALAKLGGLLLLVVTTAAWIWDHIPWRF